MVSAARSLNVAMPVERNPTVQRPTLAELFHAHFDLIWRTVRRLGVPPAAIDDAAQEVFVVASRKLDVIEPGKERAFLCAIAMRVASDARRAQSRRGTSVAVDADVLVDATPTPEDLLDQKRAREHLDALIARMPEDVRAVFVLYELEGLTMAEIAAALELAPGTVASRLRRGREQFNTMVARIDATTKGARHG